MKHKSILSLLAVSLLLGACAKPPKEVPALLSPVGVQLDYAQVTRQDIANPTVYQAHVVPETQNLWFQVDGTLLDFSVVDGDHVEKGQVLATLDVRETQKALESLNAQIEYQKQQNELTLQMLSLDIQIQEAVNEDARFMDPDDQKKQSELLDLALESKKRALEEEKDKQALSIDALNTEASYLREQLKNRDLTAPFSGTVVHAERLTNGDGIKALQSIITIADVNQLKLSGDFISDSALTAAKEVYALIDGKKVSITPIPYDMEEYLAMIQTGQPMNTEFALPNGEGPFQAGQYATIILINAFRENALCLPANTIYRDASGSYVYMKTDDGNVRQNVKTGISTSVYIEILEGLEEGDEVYVRQ